MFLKHHLPVRDMQFIFDVILLSSLYVGGIIVLNPDLKNILTVLGSSLAGAIVLAYFRRDRDYKEIFFKTACAAICGLVTGSTLIKYQEIAATEYAIAVYFLSGLLSLFFIRGLLFVTEQNASNFIVTIAQRFFKGGIVETDVTLTDKKEEDKKL